MQVLVTGGAGYIGSHIVRLLVQRGNAVVVLDDLREGHREAVGDVPFVEGSFDQRAALEEARRRVPFDAVIHMAAHCLVGESVVDPVKYYRNNVIAPLVMLEHLRDLGTSRLVFSSSAAVYGAPEETPIPETHACLPTNPYGETKLAFERALAWYGRPYEIAGISLRYFNAAGASPAGGIGEDHAPETHLVPRVLAVALGGADRLLIHGGDFPTPDGTCVRDYVHVDDLAMAHVLALEALESGEPGGAFNLGTGRGHSVLEVVETARRVTGRPIPVEIGPRRPGDPPTLVASAERAAA
ncbi:MAG: UDP-glucose 4-epimerase GalE, partial [Acidobacteriota bacterium]